MATASNVATSVDVLTPAERGQVVVALELRVAQLRRVVNAESNEAIREIRSKDLQSVEALIVKFR